MITRKELEERIVELSKACVQILNNYNAHRGAIRDCEHWLQTLEDGGGDAPENPDDQESPPPSE